MWLSFFLFAFGASLSVLFIYWLNPFGVMNFLAGKLVLTLVFAGLGGWLALVFGGLMLLFWRTTRP